MKKYLFSFLILCTGLSACAQGKKGEKEVISNKAGYSIGVKVKGMQPGSRFILANYLGDKPYARDTAFADASGIATFKGNERLERGIYMVLLPGMSYFEVIVGDNAHFRIETDTTTADYYDKMTAHGSEENTRFIAYNKFLIQKESERRNTTDENKKREIDNKVVEYKKNYIASNPGDLLSNVLLMMEQIDVPDAPAHLSTEEAKKWQYNYYVQHYWDKINFKEEGLVRTPGAIMQNIIDRYFDKVLNQDPDTLNKYVDFVVGKTEGTKELERFFIWYLTRKYETSKVMCHDGVFAHLAKQYYCTGKAFWADSSLITKICEKAEKITYTACKAIVPDLKMADINGNFKQLYNEKAPFTVVFFWDPTCGHCKKVVPKLIEMKKAFKDTIKVYAVGSEGKYDEWVKYVKEHPEMNVFTNVNKTDRYFPWPINKQNYDIQANPVIFLLDEDKKVLAKKIDENKLEEFIIFMLGDKGLISSEEAERRIKAVRAKAKPADDEEHPDQDS